MVTLFPLPVGVCRSLLFEHWVPALEALETPKTKFRGVLHLAAVASVKAMHALHLCRHMLHLVPEKVSNRYLLREYAKEVWGPTLLSI